MQLIKSLLAFLIVISLLPIHYFANIANEEAVEEVMELMKIEDENDLGAYYLINEDFSLPQPNTYSAVAPSGWDISRLGGALSVQGNRSFTVMDNSEKLPVIMNKKFNLQTKQIT